MSPKKLEIMPVIEKRNYPKFEVENLRTSQRRIKNKYEALEFWAQMGWV
jgi:hypothetical protein